MPSAAVATVKPIHHAPKVSTGVRALSLVEFLIGSGIVIAHHVFHVLPNILPILCALGLVSFLLREHSWGAMGLSVPESWVKTVLWALEAAALQIVLSAFVVKPVGAYFLTPSNAPSPIPHIAGNINGTLRYLGFVWAFALFAEVGFRGFLLNRAADSGTRTTTAYWIGMVLVAALFGCQSYDQGLLSMIDTAVTGLILGAAYLVTRRNLWVSIFANGFIQTFAVVAVWQKWDF